MSTPAEAVLDLINATTALTSIVGNWVWHSFRPQGTSLPSLNFYEVSGPQRFNGMERQTFSINCRARDIAGALALARQVTNLFNGTSSTGIFATQGTFDISRAFQDVATGLIPEPRDSLYNAPVDITILYPSSTVS